MALKHMTRKKHKPEEATIASSDGDKYSYEHQIGLDNDDIEKLDLPEDMNADDEVEIHAKGHVKSHHVDRERGGKRRRMRVQITHMDVKGPKSARRAQAQSKKIGEIAG